MNSMMMMTMNPMLTMLHLTASSVQAMAEVQSRMLRQWAEMIPRSEDMAENAMQTASQAATESMDAAKSYLDDAKAQEVPPQNVNV